LPAGDLNHCYRYRTLLSRRYFILLVILAAGFMSGVLLLDGRGLVRQLLLGAATFVFLWIFCCCAGIERTPVICCIVVATVGEIVLSIGWGLYSYRHSVIPLYVPPGHGLFYALAAATSQRRTLRGLTRPITGVVLLFGSVLAAHRLAVSNDAWGCLWWIGAAVLLLRSENQLMLSACFVYTIVLEWAGTANGNWMWASTVPYLGLSSANPPAGVGILYILLDLIVVSLAHRRSRATDAVREQLATRGVPVVAAGRIARRDDVMKRSLHATLLFMVVCAACTRAPVVGAVTDFGVFELGAGEPGTRQARFTERTHVIVPRLGRQFGFRFKLENVPHSATAIDLETYVTHPPIRMPNGQIRTHYELLTTIPARDGVAMSVTGYSFDRPQEMSPGVWTFEHRYHGKALVKQSFTVLPAR
jgi:hypothetical protein